MIEEILAGLGDALKDVQRKFDGVMVGKVTNLDDPLSLGRVQLKLPAIDNDDFSPWARVAVPLAGSNRGCYFIPQVDDEVLVAFEHGDLNAPYVIGCLWNAKALPPMASPMTGESVIQTTCGNKIKIDDKQPSIEISTSNQASIKLEADKLTIEAFGNKIELSAAGVLIDTKGSLSLKSSGEVKVEGTSVTVKGSASASLESQGTCTVKGDSMVMIN